MPVAVVGQRPDDQIAPQSVELMKQGETLLAQGKYVEADDALETALAVDPQEPRRLHVDGAGGDQAEAYSARRFA